MRRLMFIGVICGLVDEGRRLPDDPLIRWAAAAGDPARAETAARVFAAEGARALVSFGTAAGLSPRLNAGDAVIAEDIWTADATTPCAPAPDAAGRIAGVDAPLRDREARAALAATSGAQAADMETAGVAAAARATGLPVYVFRAISDGAQDRVPACALAGMRPDGTTATAPVIAGLLKSPGDLPDLIRLGRGYGKALKTLSSLGRRLLDLP